MTAEQKASRMAWSLLPLKVFVFLAAPSYFLARLFFPKPLFVYVGNNTTVMDPAAQALILIFACCGPVLLVGAAVQFLFHRQRSALATLFIGLLPALVFAFFGFVRLVQRLL
jgi:hypothetical protein